jgi:hypothetical protein
MSPTMTPPIGIYPFAVSVEGEKLSRKEILIPAGTVLTRLYGLADQDGWTGGYMWRTTDGIECGYEDAARLAAEPRSY